MGQSILTRNEYNDEYTDEEREWESLHILNLDLDNVLYPVWLNLFIIDSKYFPDSDWLKAHA